MGQVLGAEAGPFPDKVGAEIALGQHSPRRGGHLELLLEPPEGLQGRRGHGGQHKGSLRFGSTPLSLWLGATMCV